MIALEAKYHPRCLVTLYHKAAALKMKDKHDKSDVNHKEGRDILLAFDDDLGPTLRRACDDDCDCEAMCLARAAKIVRRDIPDLQTKFTGSFDPDCQVKSVPCSFGSSGYDSQWS